MKILLPNWQENASWFADVTGYTPEMILAETDVLEFKHLYEESASEVIPIEEAREVASHLIAIYKLLARSPPEDAEGSAIGAADDSDRPPCPGRSVAA